MDPRENLPPGRARRVLPVKVLPREPGGGVSDSRDVRVAASADELVALVARGDERAFEQLYDTLVATVHGLALQVVRNPAHAEEVTQEVFVEVWRTAARFDPARGSVRAWVATMARRRAIDRVRAAQAATERDVRIGTASMERDTDLTVEAVEVRFEKQQVRRCMGGLTELQREAVTLAFYRGHTHREVAGLLDVPLGTVKTRLRDGLIRLRDCMGVS